MIVTFFFFFFFFFGGGGGGGKGEGELGRGCKFIYIFK